MTNAETPDHPHREWPGVVVSYVDYDHTSFLSMIEMLMRFQSGEYRQQC
jgi:hypothetical protein